ncbi:MAG: TlpA family protein disulfide reductase [Marinilabiliaceae bacterium]|nr:TlpA family protein disulfide reductase [Marinilabiliaceae bacterium]
MLQHKKLTLFVCLAALVMFAAAKRETEQMVYADQISNICNYPQLTGDTLKEEDLKGKLIILNFWASYDPVSRMNNYELLQLGKRYSDSDFFKAKGLEVLSISLDIYKSQLVKAIELDDTKEFKHFCDFSGVDSELCEAFDVTEPVNLLIDSEGMVIARDFGVTSIASTLEILKEEKMTLDDPDVKQYN